MSYKHIVWKQRDGTLIKIVEMGDRHLANSIAEEQRLVGLYDVAYGAAVEADEALR